MWCLASSLPRRVTTLPVPSHDRGLLEQIDTNSSVKRESSGGNASLSQLLLTSPFGSNDGARFTPNDALGQPNTHTVDDVGSSAAPAGEVRCSSDARLQRGPGWYCRFWP